VRSHATSDLPCEASKIAVSPTEEHGVGPYYAEGCGKRWRYVVPCNIGGYCLPKGIDIGELLEKQAAFDLGCEGRKLQVQQLADDTFGIKGCGKQASYTLICRAGCKAVQNTQSQ
jgi:hypothetical protein